MLPEAYQPFFIYTNQQVSVISHYLSVCRSGIRGPLAYSLLGGGIPTHSID